MICARIEDLTLVKVDDSECDPSAKMPDNRNCTGADCGGIWFTGPWYKVKDKHGETRIWSNLFEIITVIIIVTSRCIKMCSYCS